VKEKYCIICRAGLIIISRVDITIVDLHSMKDLYKKGLGTSAVEM
jgi:hypothetical protein